ncbi:hypothetical protein CXF65_07695 [Psychrobacter sp. Sarcosine-3u-12]|jgi:hypothetical protein|nr:hypothetical protein CXF65_07695 [Psychrobacter sp. Sarcosine-3u-12]
MHVFLLATKKLAAPTAMEQWGDSKLFLDAISSLIKLVALAFYLLNSIRQRQQYLYFLSLFIAVNVQVNNRKDCTE